MLGDDGDNTNPFGPGYYNQGYTPIVMCYPDGTTEYYLGAMWGENPLDGKQSLRVYRPVGGTRYISEKCEFFLDAFDVKKINGQYNIYDVYMHMNGPSDDPNYNFIDTTGCREGDGWYVMYGTDQDHALYMTAEQIKTLMERNVLLVNPRTPWPGYQVQL